MSKSSCFAAPFGSQIVNGSQTLFTVVHSAVLTENLVYACVVVAFIFRNDNSLIMTRELSYKILEFITETYEKT